VQEYTSKSHEPDWIWADDITQPPDEPFEYAKGVKNDWQIPLLGFKGHGSCMLSKAAGFNFGVAKYTDTTIVRLPHPKNEDGTLGKRSTFHVYTAVYALELVLQDIKDRGLQGRSAVSLSFGGKYTGPLPPGPETIYRSVYDILKRLVDERAVVFVSSGNFGDPSASFDTFLLKKHY